ncbi:MAG: hypothetical protein ABI130_04055 [Leifsonia sp.]
MGWLKVDALYGVVKESEVVEVTLSQDDLWDTASALRSAGQVYVNAAANMVSAWEPLPDTISVPAGLDGMYTSMNKAIVHALELGTSSKSAASAVDEIAGDVKAQKGLFTFEGVGGF